MTDSRATARRRAREKRVISQMICLYCEKNHSECERTISAHCNEKLCQSCAELEEYALLRTDRCRMMHVKISCEQCENHCYKPEMREQIREVMRFSGPRMLTRHPIAAIRHLMGK